MYGIVIESPSGCLYPAKDTRYGLMIGPMISQRDAVRMADSDGFDAHFRSTYPEWENVPDSENYRMLEPSDYANMRG